MLFGMMPERRLLLALHIFKEAGLRKGPGDADSTWVYAAWWQILPWRGSSSMIVES